MGYYSQDIYAYRNNQSAYWPMRMAQHDPVGTQTLDIIGTNHLDFGAGAAEPTKTGPHGYDFDGGDTMEAVVSADVFDSDPISFVVEFTPNFETNQGKLLAIQVPIPIIKACIINP